MKETGKPSRPLGATHCQTKYLLIHLHFRHQQLQFACPAQASANWPTGGAEQKWTIKKEIPGSRNLLQTSCQGHFLNPIGPRQDELWNFAWAKDAVANPVEPKL